MKIAFKMLRVNNYIIWLRVLIFFLFVIVLSINSFGQNDENTEREYGLTSTSRNDPFPHTKLDSTIIQCRKLNEVEEIFSPALWGFDISQSLLKPFENLSQEEMCKIIDTAWFKRDTSLLPFLLKIAQCDTFIYYKYVRKLSIRCLSSFNNVTVKKILIKLLEDKDVGMISALSLIQLGQTDQSFQYIQTHYSENNDYDIIPNIVTALMIINTPDAIKLLMKISEHKDPSLALDALAALSMLGNCNFAYLGFCRYITSNIWQVRTKVANCLLYYTGTSDAIHIVNHMYSIENDSFVLEQIEYALIRFNLKNN